MLHSIYRIALSIAIICTLSISATKAQSVSFNLKTVTYNGKYSPKHVFVLWITDASGKYVKTINRQSKNYTSKLTTWSGNSGTRTTDGITGASLTSHNQGLTGSVTRIPFTWNCKDYSGNLVADGTYFVNVEFSEESTSKYYKFEFTKGATSATTNYTNVTTSPGKYFQNASLVYNAPTTSLDKTASVSDYKVYYSNSSKLLQLKYDAQSHESVVMTIYNAAGKSLYKKNQPDENFSVVLSKFAAGVYFVKFTDKSGKKQTNKIIVR